MKRLIGLILLAALGWAGFWFWQAAETRREIENWFAERAAAGWQAEYEAIRLRGFPNRLDVTIEAPRLRDPQSGYGWRAPFLQILGLTYRPGHQILAFADSQTLLTPEGEIAVTAQGLRASVVHEAQGALLRLNAEAEVLNLDGPDMALALAGLTAALHRGEVPESQRLALRVQSVAGREGALTDGRMEALGLLATLHFAEPLGLETLAAPLPRPDLIELSRASYSIEDLDLQAAGRLEVDAAGRLDGTLTLRAVNWRALLDRARTAGLLPDLLSDTLEDALALAAGLQGREDSLDIPLTLDRGQIRFGMIPLGPAPRLGGE